VGLERQRVAEIAQEMPDLEALPNPAKLAAMYQDADWQPPPSVCIGAGHRCAGLRRCAVRSSMPSSAATSAVVLGKGDKLSPLSVNRLSPLSALSPSSFRISSRRVKCNFGGFFGALVGGLP